MAVVIKSLKSFQKKEKSCFLMSWGKEPKGTLFSLFLQIQQQTSIPDDS